MEYGYGPAPGCHLMDKPATKVLTDRTHVDGTGPGQLEVILG